METKKYYTYIHIRPDTQEVFYVGVGSDFEGRYARAYEFGPGKRNKLWCKIWLKNQKQVIVRIVNVFDNVEDCLSEEVYLIKHYGRMSNQTGKLTNISQGGDRKAGDPQKVSQFSKSGQYITTHDNIFMASKCTDTSVKTIYAAISKNRPANGFFWKFCNSAEDEKSISVVLKTRRAKKVFAFTTECECVKQFPSVHSAGVELAVSPASIFKNLAGKRPTAGGYIWTYDKNDCKKPQSNKKTVFQYDMNGNLIRQFDSLSDVVKTLGLSSSTAIRNCFTGKQNQAYGYVWKESREMFLSDTKH